VVSAVLAGIAVSPSRPFDDPEFARQVGRKGQAARVAADKRRRGQVEPLGGTIVELACAIDDFQGPSWATWWAFLKALFALPLASEELAAFRRFTGRETAPATPIPEGWVIAGRKAGKSAIAALVATYLAACVDWRPMLRRGEPGVVMCLASERRQAGIVLRYVRALFEHPVLAPLVGRRTREALELRTHVQIEVHSAQYRGVRGHTVVGCVCDEIAFWRDETSGAANPDVEILAAVRPAMATVEGSVLLAISSPYWKRGELFEAYERYYGQAAADVLVWQAPTRSMNPRVTPATVDRAYAKDPLRAAAEWGAEFRRDVEAYVAPEVLAACTTPGVYERPPLLAG